MNSRILKTNPARRGSVLFAALAVVLTVTVLTSCLLQISAVTAREQTQGIDTKRAFYIAESGLSEAWYGIKIGKSGNVGTPDLPARYGDGLLWVEATTLGNGQTSLVSTGLVGTGRFSLSMVVEHDGTAVGGLGFFADQGVSIGAGAFVDSYDSSAGPYNPLPLGGPGGQAGNSRVGSNGDITIDGAPGEGTVVMGDVQPGPSATVLIGEGVTIAGSTAPANKTVALPEIDVPSIAVSSDLIVGARGALKTLPTGDSHYGLIRVPTGQALTINGPATVVADTFFVEPGGELLINASLGAVTIFTTERLSWEEGSQVTCLHEDPTQLSLQVSATQWIEGGDEDIPPAVFRSAGSFKGSVYAPSSPLTISAATEIFGAVAAQSLTLDEGVQMHFDEALMQVAAAGSGDVVVACWRVVDLPNLEIVTKKVDPMVTLKLKGIVAPLASEAHESVLFKIHYINWLDVDTIWQGDESRFNWGDVKTLVEVAREGDANFLDF